MFVHHMTMDMFWPKKETEFVIYVPVIEIFFLRKHKAGEQLRIRTVGVMYSLL